MDREYASNRNADDVITTKWTNNGPEKLSFLSVEHVHRKVPDSPAIYVRTGITMLTSTFRPSVFLPDGDGVSFFNLMALRIYSIRHALQGTCLITGINITAVCYATSIGRLFIDRVH